MTILTLTTSIQRRGDLLSSEMDEVDAETCQREATEFLHELAQHGLMQSLAAA